MSLAEDFPVNMLDIPENIDEVACSLVCGFCEEYLFEGDEEFG